MNTLELQQLKTKAVEKYRQGDVLIYKFRDRPNIETQEIRDPVLVRGNGGNHHRLVGGGFAIGHDPELGIHLVEAREDVEFAHEQHTPPIPLAGGFFYLFDRAREKGMFDDMVGPVSD